MAKQVLKDAYIAVNGTALSNFASHVDIDDSADEIDFTGFSSAGYREIGQGLKDCTVNVSWFQDFAASSVHAILQPIYSSGGTCLIEVRPTSAAVSATNPKATMTARLYSYAGLAGDVGDALTMDTSFRNAGTAGLTWGTT